ncbi:TPA: aminotransferase class I/II-fold pyridoxal phosphate-dependent enzyme, partial [Candidatus Geothermarchaeota archaeon]|nr:aminotransferase class I/II-fold pyridoxal phosphate-dependent enzyme [Candidatus Geothermarchaeota archaeon]
YIGLNGFSKQYLMTGWRLGYIYIIDNTGNYVDKAVEGILKQARSRLSPNTPAQYGAIAALKGGDKHLKELIFKLRRRTSLFYKLVSETEGMEVHRPKATFYIFPKIDKKIYGDDREFASNLLKHEGVYIVPGSGFGVYGENHFRAVTLAPENLIEEAFHRIWSYLKRLGRLTQKSRS